MVELAEIYVSCDVESTGPIPGPYSMSALGAFVAGGRSTDGTLVRFDHRDPANIFYRELAPIGDGYTASAINVGLLRGFDTSIPDPDGSRHFAWMVEHGEDPASAMGDFATWVNGHAKTLGAPPVFMAYPASFDWNFVYWYLVSLGVDSPFGFSSVLDIKTLFSARSGNGLRRSTKRSMPGHLLSDLPHTHFADDDAVEQGILGMNMLAWDGS